MSEQIFDPKHDWNQYRVLASELKLSNFRGFQSLELDFHDELTVFISKNGGGKTSILDAVWASLSGLGAKLFKQTSAKSSLSRHDINNQAQVDDAIINLMTKIDLQWWEDRDYGEEGESQLELAQDDTKIEVSISLNREMDSYHVSLAEEEKSYPLLKPILSHFRSKHVNRTDSRPLFCYYRTGEQKRQGDVLSMQQMQEWVDKRQKLTLHSGRSYVKFEKEWEWVKEALTNMLSDEEVTYSSLRVDYRPDGDYLVLDKQVKDGLLETLAVQQLSSGERILLTMVMDIAVGLIENNPTISKQVSGDTVGNSKEGVGLANPLESGFGIVLIDEVGIHLHPSWQRKVLLKLKEIFPNVQFITTTHSPLVLSGIRQEQGRLIKDFQCFPIGKVKGRDASSILEDEFGEEERPAHYQKKLERFYRLLTDNRAEAEKILDELKQIWPESDDEIIRAESYLDIF